MVTRPPQRGARLRRVMSTLRHQGPAAVARMAAHGVRWRIRRRLNASRARRGVLSRIVDNPVTERRRQVRSEIENAETRLRSLVIPTKSVPSPSRPTVGVVVAVTRDSGRLAATVHSLVGQTYEQWRCVVVDDASPEDVGSVVRPFSRRDPRVQLLRHAAVGGLPAARNTGLRHLDTDLVVFLSVGDVLVPDAITRAVARFESLWLDPAVAGVRCVVGGRRRSGADRNPLGWWNSGGQHEFDLDSLVLRRAVLDAAGGFDEALRGGEELLDLWIRLLRHGYRFEPLDATLTTTSEHRSRSIVADESFATEDSKRLIAAAEQWARLDATLVTGRGAAAPLSRSRLAVESARRAAADLGMQVATSGSLQCLADPATYDGLDLVALPEGCNTTLAAAARDGAGQALGVISFGSERLSVVARDKLVRIGEIVAEAIWTRPCEPATETSQHDAVRPRPRIDLLLAAESIADVHGLSALARQAPRGLRVAAVDLELLAGASGANDGWRDAGVELVPYHHVVGAIGGVDRFVSCAPTGPVIADLLQAARSAGVDCHVAGVGERPAALPCSAASPFDEIIEPLDVVEQSLARKTPRDGSRGPGPLDLWRGSGFPARLQLEDGPLDPGSVERLAMLRDRHRGETAVVIGNGPSLNETDLELLADVPTFGVNAIFLAADRLPRPITYYVVEDTMVFKENLAEIKAFETEYKLFPAMYRTAFDESELDDHTMFFRMNAGFYDRATGTACHPRFSLDATQRVYCGQSVTIINLQLAHWMGFRRVVLIGMDFSYHVPDSSDRQGFRIVSRGDDPNHFHPDYFGPGKTWKDPMLDRVLVGYHLAGEVYRATGREIINATVGGKLDLFPRMPLDEAVGITGGARSGMAL
jgi:glycosyl transferase family 2/6-hydroxymethylpterin diphosphokinase MptE-like protein